MAVTRYLRALTAWRAPVEYHALYDMNRATEAQRSRFLAKVRDRWRASERYASVARASS